ncbi:proline dehydrogenase family protein [Streptomonospora litoralis]|uniref:proline dehydrogenase n=1 Tax=Streptomonospora litoralis TaxID=2498135 RepID=A0A4P6Q5P5_9ACTN|nr:proline dehydrogenase family protein [Streptomonospora litoralis]QBI56056.1 Proline dehydrogenase 1 [Streptomonospora litoralis]
MVLRQTLLAASGSDRLRTIVAGTRLTRGVVDRFVAGEHAEDAVRVAGELAGRGLLTSVDHLGEETGHPAQAAEVTKGYLHLLRLLGEAGLTSSAEVSVKPTAVGLALGDEGEQLAADNISRICAAAAEAGTTVTVDMEGERHVPATLRLVASLRSEHPRLGCVLQSYLRRTEGDAAAMAAAPGSRVRLCKGAYAPDPATAYTARRDVDAAYVRSLRRLMDSEAYPMVATHDPRMIDIATTLARRFGRTYDDFEYQMLYGARPDEQRRLADLGARVRVYLPYGGDWYGYLVRRMAERPANAAFAARAVLRRG